MDFGVTLAFNHGTPVDFIGDAGPAIEDLGFHSLWVPEHVLFFPEYASRYPYADDGRIPGNPVGVLDPFSALTFVAARTERLRLGTGICLVPQRQPVYTAKMVADLDFLSRGRVDFGIGIGWLEEEFRALGADFKRRAQRCREYIEVMKVLWSQDPASFAGDSIEVSRAHFNPKPVQTPHPPIFVGGESDAALARVAEIGTGWYGFDLDPDGLAERLVVLDRQLAAAGRSRESCPVYICPNRHRVTPESVDAYRELGVDQLILPLFAANLDALRERGTRFTELVGMT